MRTPSRFMPKYTPPAIRWQGWLAVAVMAGALLFTYPLGTTAFIASLAALTFLLKRRDDRPVASLSAGREGQSICQFARSFDCRKVDTWIIRAVYEELQDYHGNAWSLPIRATDRLEKDLLIDGEDLDTVIVPAVAARTGRSMAHLEENPHHGKVTSAADLVMFFNEQPRDFGGIR